MTCEGYAYAMWYDWRDAASTCGGSSHIYATRSTNGGVSWFANRAVTSAPTHWTLVASNVAPNQGDYNGLYGGYRLALAWADGRTGDVDIWSATLGIGYGVGCRADSNVTAGTKVALLFPVNNPNVLFDQSVSYSLEADRAWPGLPSGGGVVVPEGATRGVPFSVSVPESAAAGPVSVCLRTTLSNSVKPDSCLLRSQRGAPGRGRRVSSSVLRAPSRGTESHGR